MRDQPSEPWFRERGEDLFLRLPFFITDSLLWAALGHEAQAVYLKLLTLILRVGDGPRSQAEVIQAYTSGHLVAQVGLETLAIETRQSRSSATQAVRRLLRFGFIGWTSQQHDTHRRHSILKYGLGVHDGSGPFKGETLFSEHATRVFAGVFLPQYPVAHTVAEMGSRMHEYLRYALVAHETPPSMRRGGEGARLVEGFSLAGEPPLGWDNRLLYEAGWKEMNDEDENPETENDGQTTSSKGGAASPPGSCWGSGSGEVWWELDARQLLEQPPRSEPPSPLEEMGVHKDGVAVLQVMGTLNQARAASGFPEIHDHEFGADDYLAAHHLLMTTNGPLLLAKVAEVVSGWPKLRLLYNSLPESPTLPSIAAHADGLIGPLGRHGERLCRGPRGASNDGD